MRYFWLNHNLTDIITGKCNAMNIAGAKSNVRVFLYCRRQRLGYHVKTLVICTSTRSDLSLLAVRWQVRCLRCSSSCSQCGQWRHLPRRGRCCRKFDAEGWPQTLSTGQVVLATWSTQDRVLFVLGSVEPETLVNFSFLKTLSIETHVILVIRRAGTVTTGWSCISCARSTIWLSGSCIACCWSTVTSSPVVWSCACHGVHYIKQCQPKEKFQQHCKYV